MNILTFDLETYYSAEYSLSKLTYPEYVLDERYQTIGASAKINNQPTQWMDNTNPAAFEAWLNALPWQSSIAVFHNAHFDASVLAWKYGIIPKFPVCTMQMAQAFVRPFTGRASLAACAKFYGLGEKGTEIIQARGKRLEDFSRYELAKYGDYCSNDTDLCYALVRKMLPQLPPDEVIQIALTIGKYINPRILLDVRRLTEYLRHIRNTKQVALVQAGLSLNEVRSDAKLAAALSKLGVDIPYKRSPRTGKMAYAFAKTDAPMQELRDHPNEVVQAIVEARLKNKSTIAESRSERLLWTATRVGKYPVGLRWCGAHTYRFSGKVDKTNAQNLPPAIRQAMRAPPGHKIVAPDYSQIESRITAMIAGETWKIKAFRDGEDPYIKGYAWAMGVPEDTVGRQERTIGKVMDLAFGFGGGWGAFAAFAALYGLDVEAIKPMLWDAAPQLHQKAQAMLGRHASMGRTQGKSDDFILAAEIAKLGWRRANPAITMTFQSTMKDALTTLMSPGGKFRVGPCLFEFEKMTGPTGLVMHYPNIRQGKDGVVFDYRGKPKSIFPGQLLENIVQHLARLVLTNAEVAIFKELNERAVLSVHDELVFVIPELTIPDLLPKIEAIMLREVPWMPELPLAIDTHSGDTYADCK